MTHQPYRPDTPSSPPESGSPPGGNDIELERLFQEAEQSLDQIRRKSAGTPPQPAPRPATAIDLERTDQLEAPVLLSTAPGEPPPPTPAAERPSPPQPPGAPPPPEELSLEELRFTHQREMARLQTELDALRDERDRLTARLDRLEFEFQNYRTRSERQREETAGQAKADLLRELLDILDVFDYARKTFNSERFPHSVESYQRGFNLLYRQFHDMLALMGFQRIDTHGTRFDAQIHQAVALDRDPEHTEPVVTEEIKAGYTFNGNVLRPAMVRVGMPPETPDT